MKMSLYYFTVLTPQKPCFLILLSQSWSVSNGAKQLALNNLTGDKSQQKFSCATSVGRDSYSLYQNRSAKQQHELQNVSCQLYKKKKTQQQKKPLHCGTLLFEPQFRMLYASSATNKRCLKESKNNRHTTYSFNCYHFFQTKPARITYYISDTRCCTRHSSDVSRWQAERKHPIPLKNLHNLCSEWKTDSETEKKNYHQGLVPKLYIHISLKIKVL